MSVNQEYANNVSRILENLGNAQSRGSLIQGANLSGYLQDLGQTIALAPERALRQKQIEAQTADLQSLAQERQFKQGQYAEAQKGQAALVQALQDPANSDPQTGRVDHRRVAQAVGRVSPATADAYLTQALKHEELWNNLADESAKQDQRSIDAAYRSLKDVSNPEEADAVLALNAHSGSRAITGDIADQLQQAIRSGPDALAALKQHLYAQTTEGQADTVARRKAATEAAAKLAEPMKVGPDEQVIIPGTKEVIATGLPRSQTPKSLQSENVLLDGKPAMVTFDPLTGKRTNAAGEDVTARVKPMPPASMVYPPPAAAATVQIKPGTPEYKVAQDLASGKLTFAQFRTLTAYGRDVGKKMAIYQTAAELNPEFTPAQFELGFKMASNPQFRNRLVAINALGPVIDQIDTLAQQVGNSDLPTFNKFLQGAKFQIGNRSVTNFRQLQVLLGDEVGNALGVGTGSDLKTRLGLDLVNPNLGPQQFADTMQQLRSVLDARKAEILRQMGMYAPEQPGAAGGVETWERGADGKLRKATVTK